MATQKDSKTKALRMARRMIGMPEYKAAEDAWEVWYQRVAQTTAMRFVSRKSAIDFRRRELAVLVAGFRDGSAYL
jgi:hypothetical protein